MRLLKHLFSFRGRIGRKGYWLNFLFLLVVSLLSNFLIKILDSVGLVDVSVIVTEGNVFLLCLNIALFVCSTWVLLATSARRFKDIGINGFMALYIPIFWGMNFVILYLGLPPVFLILPDFAPIIIFALVGLWKGNAGENKYGPAPAKKKTDENI